MDSDVLIVGAGPTALMLANQLARRSVRALIIDRHAGPSLQTRALGVAGRADAVLLDSYEQERIPVARRLLNTTDRALRLVVSDGWLGGLLRSLRLGTGSA